MLWRTAFRDLQWRRRRVVIAVLGASLVFALTLLLTGLSHGFRAETRRTVDSFGADVWAVREGASGPFLGQSPFPIELADEVGAAEGVTDATPVVFSRKSVGGESPEEVNLFGASGSGVGVPQVDDGRRPGNGEVAVSSALSYDVGDELLLSGTPFEVVGTIDHWTAVAGVANVFLTREDAQRIAFSGLSIVSAVAIEGAPREAVEGTQILTDAEVRDDLLRPVRNGISAIDLTAVLLWVVAASIIGSVVYLSTLERMRDFAVFKAVGTRSATILGDLVVQAVVLALAAAAMGALVARVIGPAFPLSVEIPDTAYLLLPVMALVVGAVASLAGLRRAVRADPALAFGSA
jgi:putative ABC transport system permease protein